MNSHRFKKALSQNFLHDQSIIEKIIHLVDVRSGDCVLELGAGNGALTRELVKTKGKIIAIEIDKDLAGPLQLLKNHFPNLTFYISDFKTIELDAICNATSIKFVSNLPYHLSGLFIQKICLMHKRLKTATLVVQKEVADRICSKGGKSYNSLSVFVQFFADPQYIMTVPKTCFYPIPNVDSAILHLTFHPPKLVHSDPFFSFVKKCFQGKRKKLVNCLKAHFNVQILQEGLLNLHIDNDVRAESLSMDQFLALYHYLENNRFTQ